MPHFRSGFSWVIGIVRRTGRILETVLLNVRDQFLRSYRITTSRLKAFIAALRLSILRLKVLIPRLICLGWFGLVGASAVFLIAITIRHGDLLDSHLLARSLTKSGDETALFSSLFISLAASMVGVISVTFALSLFSIQQAAEKHTPKILQEFVRDKTTLRIYWVFALLSVAFFVMSVLPYSGFLKYELLFGLFAIFGTFWALRIQYAHIVRLVDPRHLIVNEHNRAINALSAIDKNLDRMIEAGVIRQANDPEDQL